MDYISRNLERKFLHMNAFFKAILVTGARQVGKTTMLRHLAKEQNRTYVTMDNTMMRSLAQTDPVLFFQTYRPPILIDEIQKAPELLEQIKLLCDESEETGRFWLTGSQKFNTMRGIRETMAGRIGVLDLYGLSKSEADGIRFPNELDFSSSCLMERQSAARTANILDVYETIWKGGMPAIQHADAEQREEYFNSYIETYLMRDVAEIGGVTDTVRFRRFLNACAALTAEQLNYKTLADAADISQPTAKSWLTLLQSLDIVYLLPPYSNNELRRLAKTPKLYFCDTGLCAFLSMWLTRDSLMNGAASGHYYENHVVMELVKNYAGAQHRANLMYYRDSNAKEIDVIVESDGVLHPLEIKRSASPDRREVRKYELLDRASLNRGSGGIICMCEQVIPIDSLNSFIPCTLL